MLQNIGHVFIALGIIIGGWFGATPVQNLGANSTISNLTSLASADSNDLFPIVDTSAAQTKQITFSNATGSMSTYLNATYAVKAGSSNITSVGALTSGSLASGFTPVTVPLGGTGSTTLSQYQVLLGSSTNPIGIVSGVGSSGQFLTSNGANLPPTWQTAAIDQAANYTWTGSHIFAASTTHTATTTFNWSNVNSNALVANGLSYSFPSVSAKGVASTTLINDGSGNLTWGSPNYCYVTTYATTTSSGGSESDLIIHRLGIPPSNISVSFGSTETTGNVGYSWGTGYGAMASSTIVSQNNTVMAVKTTTYGPETDAHIMTAWGDVGGSYAAVLTGNLVYNSSTSTLINFSSDANGGQGAVVNAVIKICR